MCESDCLSAHFLGIIVILWYTHFHCVQNNVTRLSFQSGACGLKQMYV
jgi:hypothetical protein